MGTSWFPGLVLVTDPHGGELVAEHLPTEGMVVNRGVAGRRGWRPPVPTGLGQEDDTAEGLVNSAGNRRWPSRRGGDAGQHGARASWEGYRALRDRSGEREIYHHMAKILGTVARSVNGGSKRVIVLQTALSIVTYDIYVAALR